MARKPRNQQPGRFYHVILRGNARRDIFLDSADRLLWQHFVSDGVDTYQHRIHAYCWMTNHIHMIVQTGNFTLSGFVGTLASRYAKAFNKKYARSGHLFERRHKADSVATDSYLLELVRYIHQNPVRANMVSAASEYSWSSHRAYSGGVAPDFIYTRFILSMFDSEIRTARRRYAEFVAKSSLQADVERLRAVDEQRDDHARDDGGVLLPMPEVSVTRRESFDQLVARVCRCNNVNEWELCSPSRMRVYASLRAIIALEAFDGGIATVTEIANRFKRSQPAISRAISRLRRQRNKL